MDADIAGRTIPLLTRMRLPIASGATGTGAESAAVSGSGALEPPRWTTTPESTSELYPAAMAVPPSLPGHGMVRPVKLGSSPE